MAISDSTSSLHPSLQPIAATERVFFWHSHASLWFSLGVGLLVMQVGAYLVPGVGTRDAALAIVIGSVIGSLLLAFTARLGAETGLSSAALMHHTYGSWFARLPIFLNIAQLIGWTTFELVIMREGTTAIAQQSLGLDLTGALGIAATTLVWGVVLMLLLSGSMTQLVRKLISRFALPLVIASLVWLSWQFGSKLQLQGLEAFWNRTGDGSMSMFSAVDLVIAMPISWLPLVADYARYGKSSRGALGGTFFGYVFANIWCYTLGIMVISVSEPGTSMISALLLAQGGLIALSLILVDEIDNAYGDVYSSSVSTHTLLPKWSIRQWGLLIAVFCCGLAMVLPMHSIEPFLLMLSSVFVPLYGVIVGRLSFGGLQKTATQRKVNPTAAGIWVLGIVIYHCIAQFAPQWGAALPTLALTFLLAWLSRAKAPPAA